MTDFARLCLGCGNDDAGVNEAEPEWCGVCWDHRWHLPTSVLTELATLRATIANCPGPHFPPAPPPPPHQRGGVSLQVALYGLCLLLWLAVFVLTAFLLAGHPLL